MKKLFACTLLLIFSQSLFATSIVVLVTADYIMIGADSKRMVIDAEKNNTTYQTVCKIRNVNRYCYAAAGFIASAATSFSADSIIKFHLQNQNEVKKALRLIKKDLKNALHKELAYQKQNQPLQYKKTMEMKNNILEVVFLSMKQKTPQVHIIGFELLDEETLELKDYAIQCSTESAKKKNQIFFLGEYSGMEKYLANKQPSSDPAFLVNQLIITQSKITPNSVGAPVSLVKFTENKIEWINRFCNN